MKKYLKCLMLMLIATFCTTLSSCGEDTDEPKNDIYSIIGKWQCNYDAYGELWDEPLIYLFDEEGTGYQWFSDEPFSDRWEFTYTATSSKLVIRTKWGNYDLRYELSANGKSLIIYGWDDNDMSELHFTRVN